MERDYTRLSPKGKRRARIVEAIESIIYMGVVGGFFYGACYLVYQLQCLMGVAD